MPDGDKKVVRKRIYNIYLDESSIDNPENKYMVIGGIFIAREKVKTIKEELDKIKDKHNYRGEIKWVKTDSQKIDFLKEFIDYLLKLRSDDLSFHCIVINKENVDYSKYHDGDKELSFYKFMYTLLSHRFKDNTEYYIFPDFKPNKIKERVKRLNEFLESHIYFNKNNSNIKHIQSYSSKENLFIQIADLFSGAVGYHYNNFRKQTAKDEICNHIANRIGEQNLEFRSFSSEEKFNIFNIKLPN